MANKTKPKKVIIVGGVAGGASTAARLRRLDERCEITVYERGEYVSFANCGLPYHIGGEISDRQRLLLHSPESLKQRFEINVRILTEVTAIDRQRKQITARNVRTGEVSTDRYDVLVLSPGAAPIRPPLPGIEHPGILALRDIRDMDAILAQLEATALHNIVIVGAGFIGLEMAEQLHRRLHDRGTKLHLLEAAPHILPPLDPEMVVPIEEEIRKHGVALALGDPVSAFEPAAEGLTVRTKNGASYPADLVFLHIGVRPETSLAKAAGLALGSRGGIAVDETMRTSDPDIFALGDCVETPNFVTREPAVVPLAGPANRQGRIVADNICGKTSRYSGALGTAIVRSFGVVAAATGANERTLQQARLEYQVVYLHPVSHASYYPGAKPIHLKLLFSRQTGKILGAQAVGADGVDKRIDVIATAIFAGLSVEQLTELELCYAPPFGSAKDPINVAGMIAENVQEGLISVVSPLELAKDQEHFQLLDVRQPAEHAAGAIPGSIHIPLNEIRQRLNEIPHDRPIVAYCQSGQRSNLVCRILKQSGFDCRNLSGGYKSWLNARQV